MNFKMMMAGAALTLSMVPLAARADGYSQFAQPTYARPGIAVGEPAPTHRRGDRTGRYELRTVQRFVQGQYRQVWVPEQCSVQERQRGSYYGLGITVQSIEGRITVVSLFEGTPAHKLGMRTGDVISRIEGQDALGTTVDEAVKKLRGPKGSSVQITITRPGYETPLEFTVIRDEIPLHSVPYAFMVAPDVGYIRLTDFNETTACRPNDAKDCERDLERAFGRLKQDGATGFIHNMKRNDEELRVEATGHHLRQPFAVMAAVLFLPLESCTDLDETSSFASWVKYLWPLKGRNESEDPPDRYELVFVGLYSPPARNARSNVSSSRCAVRNTTGIS